MRTVSWREHAPFGRPLSVASSGKAQVDGTEIRRVSVRNSEEADRIKWWMLLLVWCFFMI